ncbi:MAG: tetratricopeptide repeat protein [Planctomycetes bacterium]|nr:tetratricopeptide repeat protein [Planctomycetota bacterium]
MFASLHSQTQGGDAPSGSAPWAWIWDLAATPGVVELLLAGLLLGIGALLAFRFGGLVRGVRRRRAIRDYLLGVEQALAKDLAAARRRLEQVVAEDPENHYARLLLGQVLGELGEPEQAHRQHHYLHGAFEVDSPHNELLLAQSLLGAGFAAEAAGVAERAAQRLPAPAKALELLYRAQLQAGSLAAATATGQRLLSHVGRSGAAALRQEVAATAAVAGLAQLDQGVVAMARECAATARRLDANAPGLGLLTARLAAHGHGLPTAVQQVLAASAGALVAATPPAPASSAAALPERRSDGAPALPVATFAGLLPAARYRCRRCMRPFEQELRQCPRCGALDSAEPVEAALGAPLGSALQAMDAIDANPAHIRRRIADAVAGEPAATRELVALGARAVPELLAVAGDRDSVALPVVLALLEAMGPAVLPEVFAALRLRVEGRLLPFGGTAATEVVSRLTQRFGRAALPHMAGLLPTAQAEERKILIDYFLGLADAAAFQQVLERFPPLEIVHRCNRLEAAALQRFLQALPAENFVVATLLREPGFRREAEVLAAIPGANDPQGLERLLQQRGPTRELVRTLLDALGDATQAPAAGRLLRHFGMAALDHVLADFSDFDRPEAERQRLGEVLVACGAPAVARIVDNFGAESSALDDALRAVLEAIGPSAVAALRAGYAERGWLERLKTVLGSRCTNRRVQIVRALAAIPGPEATAALAALLEAERDDNLRLHLEHACHARRAGGDHG